MTRPVRSGVVSEDGISALGLELSYVVQVEKRTPLQKSA
jgi:hypothetical protein